MPDGPSKRDGRMLYRSAKSGLFAEPVTATGCVCGVPDSTAPRLITSFASIASTNSVIARR